MNDKGLTTMNLKQINKPIYSLTAKIARQCEKFGSLIL